MDWIWPIGNFFKTIVPMWSLLNTFNPEPAYSILFLSLWLNTWGKITTYGRRGLFGLIIWESCPLWWGSTVGSKGAGGWHKDLEVGEVNADAQLASSSSPLCRLGPQPQVMQWWHPCAKWLFPLQLTLSGSNLKQKLPRCVCQVIPSPASWRQRSS